MFTGFNKAHASWLAIYGLLLSVGIRGICPACRVAWTGSIKRGSRCMSVQTAAVDPCRSAQDTWCAYLASSTL